MRGNALTFLSGRLIALVVLLGFQLYIVRKLSSVEYGRYALVFALATLMQTTISFGIPKLIPKYVSQAGIRLDGVVVRRLALMLIAVRLGATALLMAICWVVARHFGWADIGDERLAVIGALFILVGLIQIDADAMAQALSLQRLSRNVTVGEAVLRFGAVLALGMGGMIDEAAMILSVSIITATGASIALVIAVLTALRGHASVPDALPIDWRELRATALGGYASSMAWFASSPAVMRLIGARILSAISFAGFAFAQTLVLSFQRYTPGMLMFPFVEPTAMKHHARTGDQRRLEQTLSLVTKVDMIFVGAATIGAAVAGRALVDLATHGKYGAFAYVLPWILIYILTSSIYKSFEIVAVALNASSALVRTLALSVVWLAVALLLAPHYGLPVLLLCPIGDALSRLAIMHRALRLIDVRHIFDVRMGLIIVTLAAVCVAGGQAVSLLLAPGPLLSIGIGTAAASLFLLLLIPLRPLRTGEGDIIRAAVPERIAPYIARLSRD